MSNYSVIQEAEVLMATIKFLFKRNLTPHHFSVASGRGIDTQATTNKISNLNIYGKNFQPTFSGSGPDIIALSKKEWWHIECKGTGTGKKQTQRNNFDRALASVVSYFGEDRSNLEEKYINTRQYLGLALPASPEYINELIKRVRIPLRKALNLWVLLYEPHTDSIRSIPPSHNIPSNR